MATAAAAAAVAPAAAAKPVTEKEQQLIDRLRNAMTSIPPLRGEEDFHTSTETYAYCIIVIVILRFLERPQQRTERSRGN